MKKGLINKYISFPIIVIVDEEYSVDKTVSDYTICKKSAIPTLLKREEFVIDSEANYYKRTDIAFLTYINPFFGFSLKYAGFGVCYVEKKLELIKNLNIDELKNIALNYIKGHKQLFQNSGINPEKIMKIIVALNQKEEVFLNFLNAII